MRTENKIKVLIVDDEPLARRGIRQLLQAEDDFSIAAEASNGSEALRAFEKLTPDLIFLDIEMPLLDGFGFLEKIDQKNLPEIVFVTAYDEHAIRAFEEGAIDYVLKPINRERFQKTLVRIRRQISLGKSNLSEDQLANLLDKIKPAEEKYLKRIAVKKQERIHFVKASDINWIRSQNNYIEIHTAKEKFLLRETMKGIEKKLNPEEFVRIRRSTIVRIESIREMQTLFKSEFAIVLNDGTEHTSSRRYRKNLEKLLKV